MPVIQSYHTLAAPSPHHFRSAPAGLQRITVDVAYVVYYTTSCND